MRNHAALLAFVSMVAALGACAGAATTWETLPAADQRAFQRCQNNVTLRLCPPLPGALDEAECVSAARAAYAGVPAGDERRRWLAGQGCARGATLTP